MKEQLLDIFQWTPALGMLGAAIVGGVITWIAGLLRDFSTSRNKEKKEREQRQREKFEDVYCRAIAAEKNATGSFSKAMIKKSCGGDITSSVAAVKRDDSGDLDKIEMIVILYLPKLIEECADFIVSCQRVHALSHRMLSEEFSSLPATEKKDIEEELYTQMNKVNSSKKLLLKVTKRHFKP